MTHHRPRRMPDLNTLKNAPADAASPGRIRSWRQPAAPDATRVEELARLIPLWPAEIASLKPSSLKRVVMMLEQALRAERRRGRAGHWCYDLSRHMALVAALRRERARLAALETQITRPLGAASSSRAPQDHTLSDPLSHARLPGPRSG